MEHHAQSIDDALIGGLSYKLKPGASYVTNRRSVSYFASGGNTYSPNGVKVMKFNLAGDQWLDPSTFRVAFQLNNHNGNISGTPSFPIMVQPLLWNPAVFFRRARLICGGQVVEDIDGFDRLSLMLTDLTLCLKTINMISLVKGLGILISLKVKKHSLLMIEKHNGRTIMICRAMLIYLVVLCSNLCLVCLIKRN